LPYIPPCRWIPGAHNGEHARGSGTARGERRKRERAIERQPGRQEGAREKKERKKICGKKGKRAVPRASIMGV